MVKELREKFTAAFSKERYDAYMAKIEALHPGALDFRNAETPVFVPKDFKDKMLGACEDIIDVITDPMFLSLTDREIPANVKVPNENSRSEFIVFDFGICENENNAQTITGLVTDIMGKPLIGAKCHLGKYQIWHRHRF